MNLKKLAKRKWKERYPSYLICFELLISNYLRKNPSFAQAKLGFLDSLRARCILQRARFIYVDARVSTVGEVQ